MVALKTAMANKPELPFILMRYKYDERVTGIAIGNSPGISFVATFNESDKPVMLAQPFTSYSLIRGVLGIVNCSSGEVLRGLVTSAPLQRTQPGQKKWLTWGELGVYTYFQLVRSFRFCAMSRS